MKNFSTHDRMVILHTLELSLEDLDNSKEAVELEEKVRHLQVLTAENITLLTSTLKATRDYTRSTHSEVGEDYYNEVYYNNLKKLIYKLDNREDICNNN